MNLEEWFAELYSIRQRLEDEYSRDQYGDLVMLDQIIYNTKAPGYLMQLTILKTSDQHRSHLFESIPYLH
jgi:hypothetical protein